MLCEQKGVLPEIVGSTPDLAIYLPWIWPPNIGQLRVRFMDGDPNVRAAIAKIEGGPFGWSAASALQFAFVQNEPSYIRVTFNRGGSWSHVGAYCKEVPANLPTMQLGWLDASTAPEEIQRVWLHEAGHALGFIHEHNTSLAIRSIPWNIPNIKKWCAAHGITFAEWEKTWYAPIDDAVVSHPIYDSNSIMHYYVPPDWTLDNKQRGGANVLSATDRSLVAKWYGAPVHPRYNTYLPIVQK